MLKIVRSLDFLNQGAGVSVTDEERLEMMFDKIIEEAKEVRDAIGRPAKVEEFADLLDILVSVATHLGITEYEIHEALSKKWDLRGRFDPDFRVCEVPD